MVGPINGEIARLRLADLEAEANRARSERLAARHRDDCGTHARRPAFLSRLRKILA
jgi:hypothetical protein